MLQTGTAAGRAVSVEAAVTATSGTTGPDTTVWTLRTGTGSVAVAAYWVIGVDLNGTTTGLDIDETLDPDVDTDMTGTS